MLPDAPPTPSAPAGPASPAPALTALVADESAFQRAVMRDVLLGCGVRRVREARDGSEILAALADERPDLVVADWRLGLLGGPELLRLVGEGADGAPGPAVALTMCRPTRTDVQDALAAGTRAIVLKPYSPASLRARIAPVLDADRARAAAASPERRDVRARDLPRRDLAAGSRPD